MDVFGRVASSRRAEDHPPRQLGRIGLRFNVDPFGAFHLSNCVSDCLNGFRLAARQPRRRKVVVVKGDASVEGVGYHGWIVRQVGC